MGAEWGRGPGRFWRGMGAASPDGLVSSRRTGVQGGAGQAKSGKENPGRKVGGVPEAGNPSRHQGFPRSSILGALNPCSVQPLTT